MVQRRPLQVILSGLIKFYTDFKKIVACIFCSVHKVIKQIRLLDDKYILPITTLNRPCLLPTPSTLSLGTALPPLLNAPLYHSDV